MKRKVTVWFVTEPEINFLSKETYPTKKITPEYKDDKLIGLHVEVEVEMSDTNDKVIEKATEEITPLLERIRFLTGIYFEATARRIKQISPPQVKAEGIAQISVDVVVSNPSPMPTENELFSQANETTDQLCYFNRALAAEDVAERIRNFYLVIEKQWKLDNRSYNIPTDLRCTRHAVNHPELDDPTCQNFLKSKINSISINYNDPEHLKFLRDMEPKFQQEAKRILDQKV